MSHAQLSSHIFDGVLILFFLGIHHPRRPRESAGAEFR